MILLVAASATLAADPMPSIRPVECEGTYPHHLQGVCTDGKDSIFWCFTTQLVKTDLDGKVLTKVAVANHHGDLCFQDGKVYVAVNLGEFNRPAGRADSWVYVYDAETLKELARHKTPEVVHGAGGIAFHEGRFLVVGGLPEGVKENYAYEYESDFKFVRRHVLDGGHTLMGIQTAGFADGHWWFGCYGDPKILLKADESLTKVERFDFDCSLGIVPISRGRFLVGRGTCSKEKGCMGKLVLAVADKKNGLALRVTPTLDDFRKKLDKAVTPDRAVALFGRPDREPGSGLIIYEYDLQDGTKVRLGFPGLAKILYARHEKKDGTVEDLLLK